MIWDKYLEKIIKEELKMYFGKNKFLIKKLIYQLKEVDGKMDGIN